jgi:O-antigen/teichoic acid export membrane protein
MAQPSIRKNFILSTAYQIILVIVPLITAPYIARVLGPSGEGIYSYTNSIELYFAMVAELGTMSYGAREIARARDNPEERTHIFWEIEILTIITTCIMLGCWAVFIACSSQYRILYIILSLNILNCLFDVSWFFAGMEQFQYTVAINTIFKVLGTIALFLFVKDEGDLALYTLIMNLTTLLGTMTMWIALPKFLVRVKLGNLHLKKHLKETLVYFLPSVATSIYVYLDKTLLGVITKDSMQNGYYEAATKVVNLLKAVTFTSINSVVGSRISYLFAEEKYDEIHRRINDSMDYILFLGTGIFFGLLGVSENFVPWFFGDKYLPTVRILQCLSPLVLIIGISSCISIQYYTPAGLRKKSAVYVIIGASLNLILNLLFIPRWKSEGAAIASVAAELTIAVLCVSNCGDYMTWRHLWKLEWKRLVAAALMLVDLLLTAHAAASHFTALLIQFFSGSAVYLLVLYGLNDSFLNGYVLRRLREYRNRLREKHS